jgi:hypothetical protein
VSTMVETIKGKRCTEQLAVPIACARGVDGGSTLLSLHAWAADSHVTALPPGCLAQAMAGHNVLEKKMDYPGSHSHNETE